MKKFFSLLLAAVMLLSVFAACASNEKEPVETTLPTETSEATEASAAEDIDPERLPNLMVMSGPTGVGAAKLMADWKSGAANVVASASVVADNEAVKNALINGDADIAAVATNMAATLANKTDGGIQILAINTLGVLYILEKGDSVQTMADLAGKTVYATGQGANPEYILNYLLTESGVDLAEVDIQWMTAQEITAKMTTEETAICMLPVPAATAVMMKDSGVRQAISLSEVWDSLGNGALAQGCIVARTEYVEENPESVAAFLAAYEESLSYMMDEANLTDASELVAQFEITANAQIALKAIPACNLTFVTGAEMKEILLSFYDVLYQADPASVGGCMPAEDFYYGVE